jgi:hypothetical protein
MPHPAQSAEYRAITAGGRRGPQLFRRTRPRGSRSGCTLSGLNDRSDEPKFVDPSVADYRLLPTSLLIDRGFETGHDLNGPSVVNGMFNGAAPDIGASESP